MGCEKSLVEIRIRNDWSATDQLGVLKGRLPCSSKARQKVISLLVVSSPENELDTIQRTIAHLRVRRFIYDRLISNIKWQFVKIGDPIHQRISRRKFTLLGHASSRQCTFVFRQHFMSRDTWEIRKSRSAEIIVLHFLFFLFFLRLDLAEDQRVNCRQLIQWRKVNMVRGLGNWIAVSI